MAGLVVIFIYVSWLKFYILRVYRKTQSAELTINHVKFFNKYLNILLLFLDFVFNLLLIWIQLYRLLYDAPYLAVYISLLAAFVVFCLITMVNQQILFNASKAIRGSTMTRKEKWGKTLRAQSIFFVIFAVVCFIANGLLEGKLGQFYNGYGVIAAIIILVTAISLYSQLSFRRIMKAEPLTDRNIQQHLQDYVKRASGKKIKKIRFYTFRSEQRRKRVNATVTGYRTKHFFLAEDLFNDLTVKQLGSIVTRVIGQIKKKHLWIRYALLVFSLVPLYGVAYLIYWYENYYWAAVSIVITIWIYVISFVIYSRILMPFALRILERQADQYVLNQGVDYRDFVIALLKIKQLRDRPKRIQRSITRRVKWIIQKEKGSWAEVERHQAAEDDFS